MSASRRLIVDTDTGSDDVWAIVAALRATERVTVEAVTVTCGNLPLPLCVKNAMLAVDAAGTYAPPVYSGSWRPILNQLPFYAESCHGPDGLSGMNLPPSPRPVAEGHAVDKLVELVKEHPGEIEIATSGPLTNIALACLKDESFAKNVKHIYILGGAARGVGNMTPAAEYNVFVDPEAAAVVLDSGLAATWVTWDNACGAAAMTAADMARLERSDDPAARFCERCIRQMRAYYRAEHGADELAVIDSVLMLCALYPELMTERFPARCAVERAPGERFGAFSIERDGPAPNAEICAAVDAAGYKRRLFELLGAR